MVCCLETISRLQSLRCATGPLGKSNDVWIHRCLVWTLKYTDVIFVFVFGSSTNMVSAKILSPTPDTPQPFLLASGELTCQSLYCLASPRTSGAPTSIQWYRAINHGNWLLLSTNTARAQASSLLSSGLAIRAMVIISIACTNITRPPWQQIKATSEKSDISSHRPHFCMPIHNTW